MNRSVYAFVVLIVPVLVSCGGSSSGTPGPLANMSLLGTYKVVDATCSVGERTGVGESLRQEILDHQSDLIIQDGKLIGRQYLSTGCVITTTSRIVSATGSEIVSEDSAFSCGSHCDENECVSSDSDGTSEAVDYVLKGDQLVITERQSDPEICADPQALPVVELVRSR